MVKPGYKQTDIGAIPIDWDETQIKNVGYLTSGESPAHFDFSIGQIPYFKVEQLNNSVKYQAESPYHTCSTKTIDKGSIIFPKRGAAIATNKVRILGQPSLLDTNIMALTITNEEVHGEYLYYWMVRKGLWQIADTTSVPQINNKHILPLWFPLPPIVEQENIGNALADIDELITIFDRLIEKKKAIKLGAMQELLTGKKRLPGFSGHWVIKTLSEISREMVDGPFGSNLKTEHYTTDRQVRIIQLSNIGESGWSDANTKYTTFAHAAELSRCIVQPGTVLIAKMMPAGRAIICPDNEKGYILGSDVVKVIPHESVDSKYLVYATKSQFYLDQIADDTQGSTRARTSVSKLRKTSILFPSKEEQIAIATVLSNMDSEIDALEQKLAKYRQVKQGMMQQLLTGKIRLV